MENPLAILQVGFLDELSRRSGLMESKRKRRYRVLVFNNELFKNLREGWIGTYDLNSEIFGN